MKQQNPKIQILRAVAIIAVVLIHTCKGGNYQIVCRPFINFAVALFIFLSGYLTKVDNDNWLIFYTRRIKRVLIPYIIWTIIYTLPSTNLKAYIFNLATTQAAPTLYYIFVYIQFVLLTPILGKLAKSRYCWIGFIVAPLSILCYKYPVVFCDIHPHRYIDILWGVSCLGWFTFYYLGLLLGNGLLNIKYKWKSLIILYIFSILLQMLEGYVWYYGYSDYNCGTQLKLSSLLTSTIFLLIAYQYITDANVKLDCKSFEFIGNQSFGVYLCHIMTIELLWRCLPMYDSIPFIISALIVFCISSIIVFISRSLLGLKLSRVLGLS
jgi:peptidoglycan/LPS O-acetylase OafA/YrhL